MTTEATLLLDKRCLIVLVVRWLARLVGVAIFLLMGLIALAVVIDSGRPVFYRQKRVGENGRLFDMVKFRTMAPNADRLAGQVERRDANGNLIHKRRDDPRVTRVGRFLRRTSLDELPQLINVARGALVVFATDLPVARGQAVLNRTDASVEAIANYVLESALDTELPAEQRPACRCAVVRTKAVSTRTTLLLVRYRFHLELPSRSGTRQVVAEDVATLAFEGAPAQAKWLDPDAVAPLLEAAPSGNVPHLQAQQFLSRSLDGLDDVRDIALARVQARRDGVDQFCLVHRKTLRRVVRSGLVTG